MKRLKNFYIFLILLFALTAVGVLAAEIFGFTYLSDLESSFEEQAYRYLKLGEAKQNLTSLETKYKKIEPDLAKINTALPDKKDSSKLLADLDQLSKDSGLRLTLMQSTTYGKKQVAGSDPSLLQTVKGKWGYELPLEVKVEGSYVNFVAFIKRVENYQRLLDISSIEIRKVEEIGAQPDQIEAKLKVTAFLKK